MESEIVAQTLKAVGDNRKRAAEILGISRRALYDKLKKYKIA
jgi:DNA-binding NtrC family response regulator